MDNKELEFIAKRVAAATPAPWVTGSIPWQVWYDGGHGKICRVESSAYDREFIAHARQDVPALLDEVTKLKLQNSEYRKALLEIRAKLERSHDGGCILPLRDMVNDALGEGCAKKPKGEA